MEDASLKVDVLDPLNKSFNNNQSSFNKNQLVKAPKKPPRKDSVEYYDYYPEESHEACERSDMDIFDDIVESHGNSKRRPSDMDIFDDIHRHLEEKGVLISDIDVEEKGVLISDVDVIEKEMLISDIDVAEKGVLISDIDVEEKGVLFSDADVIEKEMLISVIDIEENRVFISDVDIKEKGVSMSDVDFGETSVSISHVDHEEKGELVPVKDEVIPQNVGHGEGIRVPDGTEESADASWSNIDITSTDSSNCVSMVSFSSSEEPEMHERKRALQQSILWLRQELMDMRKTDQTLIMQLMNIQMKIHSLKTEVFNSPPTVHRRLMGDYQNNYARKSSEECYIDYVAEEDILEDNVLEEDTVVDVEEENGEPVAWREFQRRLSCRRTFSKRGKMPGIIRKTATTS